MYISALEEILRIRSIPIYFIPFNSSIPFILALYLDSEKSFLLNFRRYPASSLLFLDAILFYYANLSNKSFMLMHSMQITHIRSFPKDVKEFYFIIFDFLFVYTIVLPSICTTVSNFVAFFIVS